LKGQETATDGANAVVVTLAQKVVSTKMQITRSPWRL